MSKIYNNMDIEFVWNLAKSSMHDDELTGWLQGIPDLSKKAADYYKGVAGLVLEIRKSNGIKS